MSNQDFDFGEPPVDFGPRRAQALVARGVDANPDEAARANALARSAGINPGAAYENRENLESQYKTRLAGDIVGQNEFLQDYVNAHPLAAKVSNDDYGQLDTVSQKLLPFRADASREATSVLQAGLKAFKETSDLETFPEEYGKLAQSLAANPVFANDFVRAAALSVGGAAEYTTRVASGLIGGIGAGLGELYHQAGGSEAEQAKLTRDLIVFAQVGLSGQAGLHGPIHPEVHAAMDEAAKMAQVLHPYVESGVEPPVGVHPVIDKFKTEQAELDADNLNEALKESVKSATRERDPEMFAAFAKQHTGEGQIGISADAVRKLYGDKPPEPDDGKLGFVPDLAGQLARAEVTGGDVQVPLSEYLAKVEPEVHKELADFVRARPEGMTKEEGKTPPKYEEVEKITKAAIQLNDGRIFTGDNHVQAMDAASEALGKRSIIDNIALNETGMGGFITSKGRLVNRDEAVAIADRANQMRYQGSREMNEFEKEAGTPLGLKAEEIWMHQPEIVKLVRTSDPESWLHKFNIVDNQGVVKAELEIHEEDAGKTVYVRDIQGVDGPGTLGAAAIRDVFDQIKAEFPSADTIRGHRGTGARRQAGSTGSVGNATTSLRTAAGLQGPKERPIEAKPPEGMEPAEKAAFEKASAIGMTVDQYRRYQKLIAKRAEEDTERASARAMAEQRKTQTAEWRANRVELRPQVKDSVESRPDVQLDFMLREGTKLSPEGLTDDQLLLLPKDLVSPSGVHIGDLASMLGDTNPPALVDRVIALSAERDAAGMKPEAHLRRLVDVETYRQMEAKYGSLDKNVLEEAKDQVLSETQEEMLHEETLARAAEAGLEFSLTKEGLKGAVKEFFDKALVREVSSDKNLAEAGRAGRATENALLKGDFAEAFRQKQRQYLATVMAGLARKFEKAQGQFDRLAKRFSAREVLGVDQDYTNWIHDILGRTGNSVKRSVQDLQEALSRGEQKTLADFVNYKTSHDLREVAVAEFLQDPAFKAKVDDLTVNDFRSLHDAVKSLAKNGRDEQKIIKAGEEADLAEVKGKMIEAIRRFSEKEYDTEGKRVGGSGAVGKIARGILVAHLQVETVFNRLDRFDPRGVFNQYVLRDLVEGVNHSAKLEREFSKKLGAIADGADLKEVIPTSPFVSPFKKDLPVDQQPPLQMSRKNLRAVLLNAGSRGNLFKMAKGYGVEPADVMNWLHQYATKEDWDWGQKIWDMLEEIHQLSNTMYRSMSGVEPEGIQIDGVQTPHGDYRGGYYPLIRHPTYGEDVKLYKTGLEGEGYVRATTPAGYTKARTGATYPLSLDLDSFPNQLKQMIHDISLRPAVVNAGKILYDKGLHAEMVKHLGKEYADMFIPWLRDVANTQNYISATAKEFNWWSDFARQNAITTLVGLNPGTFLKHTPTALISSMAEVGPIKFLTAMHSWLTVNKETGEKNWQFALKNSEELQRRSRNWVETMGGGQRVLEGDTSNFMTLRDTVAQIASKPIAMGDMLSALPTWFAKYSDEMAEHGVHGDAVFAADKAVRQAHGSSAITSRSQVARSRSALASWMTGFFTFFNDLMNRQVETVWRAGNALDLVKEGEHAEALAQVPKLAGRLFAYVIAPAMIEELVSPMTNDKKESWGKTAAKSLLFTLSSSWVGARDIVSAALNGRDPSAGLLASFYKSGTDAFRDFTAPKQKPENIIKHSTQLIGMLTGLVPAQVGRTVEFGYGVNKGTERPKGPWGWLVGTRYGTLKGHSPTLEDRMKGK